MSNFSNSQIYYINSSNRLSGSNGSFSYSIPIPSGSTFDRVTLLQCNIPTSFYVVPANGNTFTLTESFGGTPLSIVITVPAGNYTVLSFQPVIQALLNAASPYHYQYTVTFPNAFTSSSTGKLTFSATLVGTDTFSFTFGTVMYEQMGFNSSSVNTSSGGVASLTSSNVVKFIPEDSIYIHSDIVNDGRTDVLQEILNNNSLPFSNVVYQCPDIVGYSKPLRTNQSSVYTFSITDENGKSLVLNGLNCVFSLILFKSDNLSDLLKMYLKSTLDS